MDADLCDGYKFHKVYETIGDGRRHIWVRRNNAKNPEWVTYVNGILSRTLTVTLALDKLIYNKKIS